MLYSPTDRTYLRCCSIRAWIQLHCLEGARGRRRLYGVTSTDFTWQSLILNSGYTKEKRQSRHRCCRRTRLMVLGHLVPETAMPRVSVYFNIRFKEKVQMIHHQLTGPVVASHLNPLMPELNL